MLKDLIKEGGLYTVANFLTKGVSLLLIPFYTAYFTPSDYGVIDILVVFGAFFNAIISLQLGQGLGRYVGDTQIHTQKKIRFASTAINLTMLSYLFFGIFSFLLADVFISLLSSDVIIPNSIFYLALGSIMINGLFYCIGVYFRFLRLSKTFSILSLSHAIGNILMTLILVLGMDYGISGIFIASLIVTPIIIIIQFYLLRNHFKWYIGSVELNLLLTFSIPLIPAAVAYAVLGFTDRLFINEYLSSNELGIYGIGAKFASIVALIIAGFSMALNPIIYETHHNKNVQSELSRIFNLFTVIGSMGVLILSIFSIETVQIFTQPEYYRASTIMPILYTSILFTGIWMFSPGLNLYKKTKVIATIVIVSSGVNIILNYIMITQYGLFGTALATLISTLFNNLLLFYWANKYYKIKIQWVKILFSLFVFSCLLYLGSYMVNTITISILTLYLIKFAIIIFYGIFLLRIKLIDPIYLNKLKQFIK